MITGWGTSSRYQAVHYFRDSDGRPACANGSRRNGMATIALHDWNPDHESTCPKCRKIYERIKQEVPNPRPIEAEQNPI